MAEEKTYESAVEQVREIYRLYQAELKRIGREYTPSDLLGSGRRLACTEFIKTLEQRFPEVKEESTQSPSRLEADVEAAAGPVGGF